MYFNQEPHSIYIDLIMSITNSYNLRSGDCFVSIIINSFDHFLVPEFVTHF